MNTRVSNDQVSEDSSLPQSREQKRYVFEHQTCAMCETELEISHEVQKTELKVKEEAYCPCCGIRVRSSHHLMQ